MIITVTMNPAIDRTSYIDHFQAGELNRIQHTETDAGGKGINVSRVLKTLGMPSVAVAMVGGDAGALLERKLQALDIHTDFVPISGNTRINEKIIEQDGRMTELNEPGPVVTAAELAAFENKLLAYAKKPAMKSSTKISDRKDSDTENLGDSDTVNHEVRDSTAKNSNLTDSDTENSETRSSDVMGSDVMSPDVRASDVTGSNVRDPHVMGSHAESPEINDSAVKHSGDGNLFVISGSVPRGVPSMYYRDLIHKLHAAGAAVLLDADGTLFKAGMEAHPDIIKPNARELLSYYDLTASDMVPMEDTYFAASHPISEENHDGTPAAYPAQEGEHDGTAAVCSTSKREHNGTAASHFIQEEEQDSTVPVHPIQEKELLALARRLHSEGQKFFAISLGKDGALFCGEQDSFHACQNNSDATAISSLSASDDRHHASSSNVVSESNAAVSDGNVSSENNALLSSLADTMKFLRCPGLPVHAKSPVGAGDAMVAALAYGWQQQLSLEETARLAMACSAGAATTKGTRPPTRLVIEALLPKVEMKRI